MSVVSRAGTRVSHRASRPQRRDGFTLVEMMIVVTLVALFASFILPNLFNARQTQRERTFFSSAKGLVIQARETAISTNQTLDLAVSGARLSVSQESSDTKQKGDEVSGLDIPDTITPSRFQLAGQDSNATDWLMKFYPDGSSDAGGVEFTIGGATQALNVDGKANPSVSDQLADNSQDQWAAGTYETR